MNNLVAHFEIVAIEPERAIDFYTNVFGWEIKKWEEGEMDYWMVMTTPQNIHSFCLLVSCFITMAC